MASYKKLEKIVNLLQNLRTVLPLLIFALSSVFFFAHCHIELNFHTYLSENALSPDVVENEFYGDDDLIHYYSKIRDIHKTSDNGPLQSFLVSEMETIGLDVGRQNYSLTYPELFGVKRVDGANVYGIMRSPGIARTEAIVLTCWIGSGAAKDDDSNDGAIALLLAIAKSFRYRLYWAKDIIFLFTDMHYLGLQAWLDSYHGTETPRIKAQELFVRSGSIQAALNFEIPQDRFQYANLKIEGLNGIMPNLDLINTFGVLGPNKGLSLRLHNVRQHPYPYSAAAHRLALSTLTRMMLTQASGSPNGQHGLFLPFQITALTVSAGPSGPNSRRLLPATARTVEGAMRSLNNLQERFHQSFFFYLLPRLERYFSIGVYMVPFGGIVAAMLLQVILLWMEVSQTYEVLPTSLWWQLLPMLAPCFAFGMAAFAGADAFMASSRFFGVSPNNGLMGGLLALSFSSLFFPWMLKRRTKRDLLSDWRFFKCVILIAQALVIGCLGVLNISMAIFVSLFMVPMALIACPVKSWLWRLPLMFLLFLTHPIAMVAFGSAASLWFKGAALDVASLSATLRQVVLQGFVEQEFLGSWTFRIATTAVFPIWLLSWGLIMS